MKGWGHAAMIPAVRSDCRDSERDRITCVLVGTINLFANINFALVPIDAGRQQELKARL